MTEASEAPSEMAKQVAVDVNYILKATDNGAGLVGVKERIALICAVMRAHSSQNNQREQA